MEMQIMVQIKYTSATFMELKVQGKYLDRTQLWTQVFKMMNK